MDLATQAEQVDQALGAVLSIDVDVETLTGDRQTITVTPFRGKQIAGLLRCVNELAVAGIDFTDLKSIENFSALLTDTPDIGLKLIAEAITPESDPVRRPKAVADSIELVGYQQIEELTNLGHAVWIVNKNYFQKKGAPLLALFGIDPAQLEELKAKWIGAGSSPGSSTTAIVSPTSANTP